MKLVLPRNGSPHFHTLDFFSFAEKEGGEKKRKHGEGGRERERSRPRVPVRTRSPFYISVIGEIALIPANRENGTFGRCGVRIK